MAADIEAFKLSLRRWVLIIGISQVLFGCLVGFVPPTAVPWFRGIVMAHIEFTANGVLMTVAGLLIPELRLPRLLLHLWFWTLLIGTWRTGGLASSPRSRVAPRRSCRRPTRNSLHRWASTTRSRRHCCLSRVLRSSSPCFSRSLG